MKLRPYQLAAVDDVRRHLRAGVRRVLLVAPTGAGKTVIASHIVEASVALGNRVLFMAHRRELIGQAFRKLLGCTCSAGYEHDSLMRDPTCRGDGMPRAQVGVVMASDRRRNPGAVVQVASVDTLRNRAKPAADLVIIDEAHRALASTYRTIVEAYPDAGIIGLTATPYRADGRGLGEAFDELVVVASPRKLIDDGFLVEPRVFTVPAADLPDLSKVKIKGGDYDEGALATAVDQTGLVGNIVEHWMRHGGDRQTVAFAVNVEHSRHIAQRFRDAGVAAEHLDGTTPTDERDAILARLERGETRIVSNCAVLTEGWDQPSVKCAILARPTKSTGLYLQCAGRILRPWRDTGAVILDHAGCVLEHGLPQDDREFSLDAAKRKQRAAPKLTTCLGCFAILPASTRVCPECGAQLATASGDGNEDKTLEHEGELVEVRPAAADEKRAEWDMLCALATQRGYQRGWVYHRYVEKFGTKPPSSFTFGEPAQPDPNASLEERLRLSIELLQTARDRGYKPGWVAYRYKQRFGTWPPNSVLDMARAAIEVPRIRGDFVVDAEPEPDFGDPGHDPILDEIPF